MHSAQNPMRSEIRTFRVLHCRHVPIRSPPVSRLRPARHKLGLPFHSQLQQAISLKPHSSNPVRKKQENLSHAFSVAGAAPKIQRATVAGRGNLLPYSCVVTIKYNKRLSDCNWIQPKRYQASANYIKKHLNTQAEKISLVKCIFSCNSWSGCFR